LGIRILLGRREYTRASKNIFFRHRRKGLHASKETRTSVNPQEEKKKMGAAVKGEELRTRAKKRQKRESGNQHNVAEKKTSGEHG